MRLENPEFLWLFLAFIPLTLFFFWESRQRAKLVVLFGGIVNPAFVRRVAVRATLLILIFSLLILAMINPQLIREKRFLQPESNAQVVALFDVSKSMAARPRPDIPDRLMRSKSLFLALLPQFRGSEVAVFAFTDVALSHISFTTNYELVRETLQEAVAIESTPLPGSDLFEALERITKRFDPTKDQRILIIFTDGVITKNYSDFEKLSQELREANVTLVVVGVGEKEGAMIPIFDKDGSFTGLYVLSRTTKKPYVSSLNEESLQQIARGAGGMYFPEKEHGVMRDFFSSHLANTVHESEIVVEELIDLYPFFAAAAFVSFIVLLKWYQ